MFRNFTKTTLRRIKRHKGYSFIILAGLTIGLTCFILISAFVRFEYSYDRFHENSEGIYRILVDTGDVQTVLNAPFSMLITPSLADKYFGADNPVGKTLSYFSSL